MKYTYALVFVLLVAGGCSRQEESVSLSVSQLTTYLATQDSPCKGTMTIGGGIKYSCAAQ